MTAADVLPGCSLAVADPKPGQCNQCGKTLTGRQQRWCSQDCASFYGRNHWWTTARSHALMLATGWTWATLREAGVYDWRWWIRCDQCGEQTDRAEVNHVDPRNGGPYDDGCWNHQTNLQVLCHDCHVAETTRQIRERRGIPEDGRRIPPERALPPMDPLWDLAS